VSVRRLGLASIFGLPTPTLQFIILHGGWQQLQALLLQLLGAFESEKLVSDVAAGSATGRQAQAVAALQQQLTAFLAACMAVLQKQCAGQDVLASLIRAYLDRVVEVAERAPTAAVLLQAAADAASQATAAPAPAPAPADALQASSNGTHSSNQICDLSPQQLLTHVGAVLAQVHYLHPTHLRPQIQSAVLQLVPLCCSASSCGAEAPLSLLAASGNTAAAAAAAATAADASRGGFMQWLDAALSARAAAEEETAGGGQFTQLQLWLQPLQSSSSSSRSSTPVLPQLKLLQSLGLAAVCLSSSNQETVADVLNRGAAAVKRSAAAAVAEQSDVTCSAAAAATALACLGCGVAASLQPSKIAAAGAAGASIVGKHYTPSTMLLASLQQLVPVLLRHHKCVYASAGVYDATWVHWLTQLLQNVLHPAAAAAATAHAEEWKQLQSGVFTELATWQQHLATDLAHAAVAAELDQQLLLLSTSHMTCYSLVHTAHNSNCCMSTDLDSCLQSLCKLVPGDSFSSIWQAGTASSSSSSSRLEMTDALMELRVQLMAQLVAAAAAAGAGVVLCCTTQKLVLYRWAIWYPYPTSTSMSHDLALLMQSHVQTA
jgi:hypothetical protein